MPSTIGNSLRVTVFGQSHSLAVGCVIEGLPAGIQLDQEALAAFMARRAPGRNSWSTPRSEADEVRILSGLNPKGVTCGAPLALVIENTNTRSQDYDNLVTTPRPGHVDWVADVKWNGNQDVPGGGHFSARLTAPLCAAGAICLQALAARGVRIGAHLSQVGGVPDDPFAAYETSPEAQAELMSQLDALADGREFPTISPEAGIVMREVIEGARVAQDSVGGVVECVVCGLPTGIGSPMFDGMENLIARAAFGIPAVKGVEFGRGFDAALMRGSQHNDPYHMVDGTVRPASNNAGGILGGITTGQPLLFRVALKPTSSIGLPQDSVNLTTGQDETLVVNGRHDPCVAPRAVPVVEAIAAIAVMDAWLSFPPQQDWASSLD